MGESFVDVSYRGLDLGRRLKLRDVRADSGYLELPLPMPVGTKVVLDADGVKIEAQVTAIHEQVGGSDQVPGMKLAPKLAGDAAKWWSARVDSSLPLETPAPAPAPAPAPVPDSAAPEPLADDGRTTVMAAVDLEALGIDTSPNTDNKKTQTMDAIDVSLITGRASSQIGIAAMDDEDSETEISIEAGEPEDGVGEGGEVSGEMAATPSGKVAAGNGKGKRRGKGRTSARTKRPTKG